MCTYSMVGDWAKDVLPDRYKWIPNYPIPQLPDTITRAEFDALKRDIEDIKKLLLAAKKYDKDNGEPECEVEEKVKLLKRLAELVGVDLDKE